MRALSAIECGMWLVYRSLGYLGLVSVFGVLLYGFRYDPRAPGVNLEIDLALYGGFVAIHLVMTGGWFKSRVWGVRAGSPVERQVYILTSVATWFALVAFHRPLAGPHLLLPEWVRFVGLLFFLLSFQAFFEGVTFSMLDGLLAVPGAGISHSHGSETPLLTTGSYARVRHPMYRAALLAGLSSLIVHPNAAQLFWAVLIGITFVGFIPVEEKRLVAARGEAYLAYRRQTPYRLLAGLW